MKDRVSKNYHADEGERLVIGGVLEFEDGSQVKGFPGADNMTPKTTDTASGIREDLNDLIVKLKNAGVMIPDEWDLSVRLAPSLTDAVAAANNAKASVVLDGNEIIVTAVVDELEESTSSAPGQGTHKWIGLGIGTGLSSVTLAKYNDSQLTADDATEAASVGLDQDGEFVLYIRAEEVAETPKTFTLDADGYAEVSLRITMVAPAGE